MGCQSAQLTSSKHQLCTTRRNQNEAKATHQTQLPKELQTRLQGQPTEHQIETDAGRLENLTLPCYRPLKAYRSHGGGVEFDSRNGFGDRPIDLACGQCIGCRAERSRQWAIRCIHESQLHEENSFITLTYDDNQLPPDLSLNVTDWQKFAKRLRKKIGSFRFFMCGEYGDKNGRPHYHACLFGHDFSSDRTWIKGTGDNQLFHSQLLEDTWGKGITRVGLLTYTSAHYVSKYILKKVTGDKAEHHYEYVDHHTGQVWTFKPEFNTMSRGGRTKGKGGIGSEWIKRFRGDVFPSDEVVHEGKRFRPPRFYEKELQPDELENIKRQRKKNVGRRKADLTPERLKTREQAAKLKLQQNAQHREL